MAKGLNGRVIVITGAAQGIGRVYARRLVAEGARVVVADIDGQGALRTATELGQGVLGLSVDVAERASVQEMIRRTVDAFGRVDVLVNNAALFGPLAYQPIEEIDPEVWDRVMA